MILQALCEYYDRKADAGDPLPPVGFEEKAIPFVLVLDTAGNFVQLRDTREIPEKGKPVPRSFLVPQGVKRSGAKAYETAYCLWDHYGYVLSQPKVAKPDSEPSEKEIDMAAKQHQAFVELVDRLAEEIPDDQGVQAVRAFLHNESEKEKVRQSSEFRECLKISGCNLTFQLSTETDLVCQSPHIQQWIREQPLDDENKEGVCLVTGERSKIARLHPPVKGVWGAQMAGANIVSFNIDSFNSWGKEKGNNAPVSEDVAFKYTTALNQLLRTNSPQRMQLNEISVVWWSTGENQFEQNFSSFFNDSPKDDPDQSVRAVRQLFESLQDGSFLHSEGTERFYLLGLSPNAARIAIRFWQVGTVAEFGTRIAEWFQDIELADRYVSCPPLKPLLRSTALLRKEENVPPNLQGETIRNILMGLPLPASLLQAAIKRIKAEKGDVSPYRASLIKAYLNRLYRHQKTSNKEITMAFNPEEKRIGYRLGCLFAVLEKLQADANPGLNATIRDRYYSSASCTPKAVFGTLMRLHAHHLKKLQHQGQRVNAEKRIAEIMSDINDFPAHLNLEEQGLFAIGYYHQRQALFTKKETASSKEEPEGAEA
ncbi:type I-C CRISPR-associated protein Cas8c/Csd1 [Marinobacter persicus]|uniref:CRISPR-associated Csd1 family protein n=1 Tax=Marinobacter persicus TaxID=930118 RepID=A0A2S6G8F4_9GAMM|nr:type I-C CRISPR-associated protein Cas8c/Csd1 [Marinobacter persicus]PPK52381.1 CRISPR-associated Csd1 family protein [Marinobacter persicus]PPK55357.1 CRISPR-associated Csd1 family protein [Marinobacter persicus]PPK59124.1 CRISPR-associated Csd1 family protein [Marinobacter persicus]